MTVIEYCRNETDVRECDIGTDLDIETVFRAEVSVPIEDARFEVVLFRCHVISSQIKAGSIHRRCYPEHPTTRTVLPEWEGPPADRSENRIRTRYACRHRPRRKRFCRPRL